MNLARAASSLTWTPTETTRASVPPRCRTSTCRPCSYSTKQLRANSVPSVKKSHPSRLSRIPQRQLSRASSQRLRTEAKSQPKISLSTHRPYSRYCNHCRRATTCLSSSSSTKSPKTLTNTLRTQSSRKYRRSEN